MKNIRKKFFCVLIAVQAVCMFSAYSVGAYADNSAAADVRITVSQVFRNRSGSIPPGGETFSYALTAEDRNDPMPEGSKDGALNFSLSGNDSRELALSFDREGVYKYKLEHVVTNKEKGYSFDVSQYRIEVHVTAGGEGGLTAAIILIDESGRKPAEIVYRHSYSADGKPPKTGDPADALYICAVSAACMMLMLSNLCFLLEYRKRS